MVYVTLDWRSLGRWVGQRRLIRGGTFDEGYALHVLLSGVFGKSALQPFRLVRPRGGASASLYAYADQGANELREMAAAVAPPEYLDVIRLANLAVKDMPERFRPGTRLGFDVRVRPVRRLARDLSDSQSGKTHRKGSEMDAFRLELMRRAPEGWREGGASMRREGISRQSVYAAWLAERLRGAADVDVAHCRLADFRRSRTWRGNGRPSEGPDATLQGDLVVRDPAAFAQRVRCGVGRHRAYGYGMLLARPPRHSAAGG